MKKLVLSLFLILVTTHPVFAQDKGETLTYGPFGDIHVYKQTDKPANIVLFISGDGGWNLGVIDMAKALTGLDALVAGIDITHYLKQTGTVKGECTYSAADLESLSQFLQTKYGYDHYTPPVLVGYSSGATLVYGALVQGPPNTFAGAISMGFCPDLPSPKPLCKGSGLFYTEDPNHKGTYIYGKASSTPAPWTAFQGETDQVCDAAHTKDFVNGIGNADIISLPGVGHGFSVEKNWLPQFKSAFEKIVANKKEADAAMKKPQSLEDLPIVENGVSSPKGKPLAIIVTGDGGWAGIDREIGNALNAEHINVVGLNSLQYYWEPKTPEQSSKDLSRILAWYQNEWAPSSITLIGYSLGGDVLPFMINRLPQAQKEAVKVVAVLGAGREATFAFHVSDWLLTGKHDDALPIKPEAEKITNAKFLCFYGEDETDDSLCPTLDPTKVTVIKTKGGHHFGGDYKALADKIRQAPM